jgi:hypothetical protein
MDRYWVGGTGTWDGTSTTNWSATSGGAGGASVPTAADNVFFNANSNVGTGSFTVTMATSPRVCNDFTASGLDGVMTLAGTSIGLTVSGSLSFPVTNFTRSYSGTTTFNATTTGKTITTNGVTFGNDVTFNGVGGGWTLGSALNASGAAVTVTNGTFDTGGYSVTASTFSSSNTNTRTINLNASTVNLSIAATFTTSTNLTFNAGTSTINVSAGSATFAGGGQTFYNVAFTSTTLSAPSISGANTFNNLSVTGRAAAGIAVLTINADQTINGTFTVSAGTAAAYRTMIASNTLGATRTLTCAAESLTDVDFRDITAAGAASPFTGTRLGDCKGNSNITFDAAKTVYYRQTGSVNWGSTGAGAWSATSGSALDATMFPLAQDTAVFPAATYPASGSTTTINAAYNIGTIDMSLRTSNTMTLATGSTTPNIYGNWINGTGTTISGTGTISFTGRTTQQITSAGRSFTQPLGIVALTGTVQLQDAFTTSTTVTTTLSSGTLDLQSYTLSTGLFSSTNSNTRTIAFGTGNITCTGTGTVWTTSQEAGLTTTGTQVVNVTSTGSTSITVTTGGLSEINSISYNFTGGTYLLTFVGNAAHTARNANFTGFAGTLNNTTFGTFYGNIIFSSGMTLFSSANGITFGATSGTQQITTNGNTINFPITFNGAGGTFQLQDALTMGSTRDAALANGTLDLNGKTMTVGTRFRISAGTKNLTFNGGTLVCPDPNTTSFNNSNPTGFTTTAGTGTGTISMTAATAKTFVGGGSTYNCTLNQGGAGQLTVSGSNTFLNITNTVQPATVLFTAGTTNIFTSFSLSGTAGNLITLGSTTTSQATLQKGSTWFVGANSTNGGNNTGLTFTAGGGIDYLNVSYINGTVVTIGTTYDVSLSDATTITDEFFRSISYASFFADTTTATDAVTNAGSTYNAPSINTSTAADEVIAKAAFYSATANTSTAADEVIAKVAFYSTTANTSTVTDAITNAGSIYSAPVTNISTINDAITPTVTYPASVSNTTTVTDTYSLAATFNANFYDSSGLTATDIFSSLPVYSTQIAETGAATENLLVAPSTFNAYIDNDATITEYITNAGSVYSAPVAENIISNEAIRAVFLWNPTDDVSETWNTVQDQSESWSDVSDQSESWTIVPDTDDIWTQVSDNSTNWTPTK